jgi:broad specificity phosphatase PhoE
MKTIHLYLVRHGESESNTSGILKKIINPYQDPNLTEQGILQAKKARDFLKKMIIHIQNYKIFTSVLLRAQETALILFPHSNIHVSGNLKETSNIVQKIFFSNMGENIPIHKISQQRKKSKINPIRLRYDPSIFKNDFYNENEIFENGNIQDFLDRYWYTFKDGEYIFIVCHGHLIRKFLSIHTSISNCSIFKVYNTNNQLYENDLQKKRKYKLVNDQ